MKWLMINAYFPPEIGSASFLFFELGKKLVEKGDKVTVLTGFPRYNINSKDLPEKYKGRLSMVEEMEGIKVVRMRLLSLPRYIPIARGMDHLIMAFLFFIRGLFIKKASYDRILVYSPPLPLGLTAYGLSKINKKPFICNVQDLFPQSAIDLGVLTNKAMIGKLEKLESFIYNKADIVTVHSEGNRNHVISKGVKPSSVITIPNWIDTDMIQPKPIDLEFRKEFLLNGEFIVSFAGVIGYSQDLDTVIESAEYLKKDNIIFLIVGYGVEKERLQEKVKAKELKNVRFLPMLPKEKYVRLLAASDACLVNLHKEVKTPVVPSKLLSIMSAGRAVAASLPLGGDAPKIIKESKCGICVDAGDCKGLAEAIRKIYLDKRLCKEFANNGRDYVVENFSLTKCLEIYRKLKTA
ncbi:MAG: glycosyltransferase family 4 protein [Candidatus Omnitrophica bacterium]|nr:glycosyltransferase family 4 protein [Candidatus Omnitrophota bacterium]